MVGIMPVDGDDNAVALMNDSVSGLTASIWTADLDAALAIGDRVETGTGSLNSCDHLDPALAWTGVEHSGRGCLAVDARCLGGDPTQAVSPEARAVTAIGRRTATRAPGRS